MSFPRYLAYKDSGVEWLGNVPAHWSVKRLRQVATLNPSKTEVADLPRDTEVSFLPMEAVGNDGTLSLDRTRVIGEVESGYTYFREGDVTVAKITPCFENGKGAVMRGLHNGHGFGTTELIVVRPSEGKTTSDYLHLLFTSHPFRLLGEAAMYGAGGQKRVSDDFVRDFAVAFPTLPEQIAIAAFLDCETAKIDALVAEQEKLIALLLEKRQAVISHAVTKGLNANVPMKDSGVEWLGEVPAHWEVAPLKRIVVFQRGHDLPTEQREDGNVPVISSGGYTGTHSTAQAKAPGIVTGRYGSIGTFTFVNVDYWPLNTALYSIELYENFPKFVWYLLHSISEHFLLNSLKSAVPGVDRNDIHVVSVATPKREEQELISTFLDRETAKLDTLMTEARTAIALLQERRTALISAAVTGQIDVRDLASCSTV